MEIPKDKRTKEYKEWKANFDNSKDLGLGDVVEKITEATGIKKLVKFVAGEDCGCNERKAKLNELFPIRKKPQRCFTEQQYNQYADYTKRRKLNTWENQEDQRMLIDLYAHVFAIQYNYKDICVSCEGSGRILKTIDESLDQVFKTYQK